MRYKRNELIDLLRDTKKRNGYIIAAGAGSGLSAKSIEKGGADLLMVINTAFSIFFFFKPKTAYEIST